MSGPSLPTTTHFAATHHPLDYAKRLMKNNEMKITWLLCGYAQTHILRHTTHSHLQKVQQVMTSGCLKRAKYLDIFMIIGAAN